MQTAVILLAHGSRDPHWLAPFNSLINKIKAQTQTQQVELAFMELAEPSLSEQVTLVANNGAKNIAIVPLFFAEGRHLRHDVPQQIKQLEAQLAQQHLAVDIHLHSPIGLEPEVVNAIENVVLRRLDSTNIN